MYFMINPNGEEGFNFSMGKGINDLIGGSNTRSDWKDSSWFYFDGTYGSLYLSLNKNTQITSSYTYLVNPGSGSKQSIFIDWYRRRMKDNSIKDEMVIEGCDNTDQADPTKSQGSHTIIAEDYVAADVVQTTRLRFIVPGSTGSFVIKTVAGFINVYYWSDGGTKYVAIREDAAMNLSVINAFYQIKVIPANSYERVLESRIAANTEDISEMSETVDEMGNALEELDKILGDTKNRFTSR